MTLVEAVDSINQVRYAVVVKHSKRTWGNGVTSPESHNLLTYSGTGVRSGCPRLYDTRKKAESVAKRSGGTVVAVTLVVRDVVFNVV